MYYVCLRVFLITDCIGMKATGILQPADGLVGSCILTPECGADCLHIFSAPVQSDWMIQARFAVETWTALGKKNTVNHILIIVS